MRLYARPARSLLLGGVALAFALLPARPADAQLAVVCPLCSNLFTQIEEYTQQALQYQKQVQSYVTQLQQYQIEFTNAALMPRQIWVDAQADINGINNIINQTTMLNGQIGAVTGRLQALPQYTAQLGSLGNMSNQYQNWANMLRNTIQQANTEMGTKHTQQLGDEAKIALVEAQAAGAVGTNQAIQAGTMAGIAAVGQLQQLVQMSMVSQQMDTDWIGHQADREAAGDAALLNFLSTPTFAANGNPRY